MLKKLQFQGDELSGEWRKGSGVCIYSNTCVHKSTRLGLTQDFDGEMLYSLTCETEMDCKNQVQYCPYYCNGYRLTGTILF